MQMVRLERRMLESKQWELKLNRNQLYACWNAVKTVIGREIPEAESDFGVLMELLSKLAEQDKETDLDFIIVLDDKFVVPLWHSLNIVIQNRLHPQLELENITQAIFKVAEICDSRVTMGVSPLRLIK